MTTTREQIAATIDEILSGKGAAPRPLQDGDTLVAGLGFDSLDLAVLVVKLEQRLDCDPFRDGRSAVATFGELVAVYEEARGGDA